MAVFAWVAGNPFDQPQDDQVFYDAVSDVSSDIFVYAAGRRLWSQRIAYDALTYRNREVIRWLKVGDNPMPSADEWSIFGMAVFVTAVSTILPYTNPWTVAPAFVLDAYNIYRYFE
jgi:hypothetical protein